VDGPGVLLPIGVMVGARLGEEETLLALAGQLEQAMPWRHRRAPIR
jgi:Asp-tRNA(Asn)/Glu-tRNA(Gln) amidotransferase A subunit family amidase